MLAVNETNCNMLSCGAIPAGPDHDNLSANCAGAGFPGASGGYLCSNPICAPFKAQILTAGWGQGLECCVADGGQWTGSACITPPVSTPAATPDAPQVNIQPSTPVLTTSSIVQALPDITQANTPVVLPNDSCWCKLNAWLNENPLLALLGLAAAAMLVLPKGGRA